MEHSLREDTYPLFLKSEVYLDYIRQGGSTMCVDTGSPPADGSPPSPAVAVATIRTPLATVEEDKELVVDVNERLRDTMTTIASTTVTPSVAPRSLSLTHSTLLATRRAREAVVPTHFPG